MVTLENQQYPILVKVFENASHVGNAVADRICSLVFHHRNQGRNTVLGLAAGATYKPVYEALSGYREGKRFSFSTCHTFALDEYYPITPLDKKSLSSQIESGITTLNINVKNRHALKGDIHKNEADEYCRYYERLIAESKGIDLQLLGIGRNGHIGFNEPGSLLSDRTRMVCLSEETRVDAASSFGGLQKVPHRSLTMGIATILDAEEICLVAIGSHKALIVKQFLKSIPNPALPASYLKTHAAISMYLDLCSAKLIPITSNVMVIQ